MERARPEWHDVPVGEASGLAHLSVIMMQGQPLLPGLSRLTLLLRLVTQRASRTLGSVARYVGEAP